MKRFAVVPMFLMTTIAVAQDSLLPELRLLRAEYPTPMSSTQIGELLTRTAAITPGWVLLRKPTGVRCPTPMGVDVSCDYLVWAPLGQGYDVLIDSDGAATPTWAQGDSFTPDRYVQATAPPGPAPAPVPAPVPAPAPAVDLQAQILVELRAHEAAEAAEREQAALFRRSVADKWKNFGVFVAKYAPIVLGAIYAGRATK